MQTDRYEEYPKLRELVVRKDELVRHRATPPYFMKVRCLMMQSHVFRHMGGHFFVRS